MDKKKKKDDSTNINKNGEDKSNLSPDNDINDSSLPSKESKDKSHAPKKYDDDFYLIPPDLSAQKQVEPDGVQGELDGVQGKPEELQDEPEVIEESDEIREEFDEVQKEPEDSETQEFSVPESISESKEQSENIERTTAEVELPTEEIHKEETQEVIGNEVETDEDFAQSHVEPDETRTLEETKSFAKSDGSVELEKTNEDSSVNDDSQSKDDSPINVTNAVVAVPPDNRFIHRTRIHQLGAMAFIGLVLYLSFLPRWDFKDIVGMAPPEAIVRGKSILSRKGFVPESYTLKSIKMEKIIGFAQLSFFNRYCDLGAVERIRDLGIPLSLYELEYSRKGHRDIRMWINPTTGSLFTMTFYPPPGLSEKRDEFHQELLKYRRMAISDSLAELVGIDVLEGFGDKFFLHWSSTFTKKEPLRSIESSIDSLGTIAKNKSNQNILPTKNEAIALTKTELIRSGIVVDMLNIKNVTRGGMIYDWRIVRESDMICSDLKLIITSYVIGGHVYTDKPDVYLPETWLLSKDWWQYFRWFGLSLLLLAFGLIVGNSFVRKFLAGEIKQPFLKTILIVIIIVEIAGAINELPTHNDIVAGLTRFFLRLFFVMAGATMSWITLDDRGKRFSKNKYESLRYRRDGIIIGLLGAVALMGLHNFLIWVGSKTGIVIGSSFLLGEKILSGLPSFTGFLPAIFTIRKGFEILCFPFVFVFALGGIFYRKFGKGQMLFIISLISISVLTLIEGTSPLVYIVLLIGNLVLATFIFVLVINYFKDNIISYVTAIIFYIFLTDGFHLIKGSLAPFFAFNGLALIILSLIPAIIALHISFFSPLKEKFKEPIEELDSDDDWKLTT